LGDLYSKADVFTKKKILCSIFISKLIFENKKYRTPILNKRFDYIYEYQAVIVVYKNKNGREYFDNLPLCTLDEQEIQNIKVDLEPLFSLKLILIS